MRHALERPPGEGPRVESRLRHLDDRRDVSRAARSLESDEAIEEERRLFYVAVTRAKDELYLTYPHLRLNAGYGEMLQRPSRFLGEVPKELLEEWQISRRRSEASQAARRRNAGLALERRKTEAGTREAAGDRRKRRSGPAGKPVVGDAEETIDQGLGDRLSLADFDVLFAMRASDAGAAQRLVGQKRSATGRAGEEKVHASRKSSARAAGREASETLGSALLEHGFGLRLPPLSATPAGAWRTSFSSGTCISRITSIRRRRRRRCRGCGCTA